ncbi:SDR family NAD(P)-dependent oxidoreductase [Gordonia westfalica]|uniref:SDR family NAD(P)-dependent oxidoreductase n=1 Tax=Gordonia westfalica TaxID=158898 RepID=A0ABU2GX36_9ACTN|nr:SDR family NAD(P)-dependent oxidoreductase [Gordonia westfalica]MDS1115519.1 SDR family NAD(P)-dependent oxidoreductase [Gordonia westfalica]
MDPTEIDSNPWTLVMTGGTRGIGRIAAHHVLTEAPECRLVVLARGGGAVGFAHGFGELGRRLTVIDADLADMCSTRSAVGAIGRLLDDATLPPLRGLAGNAGIQFVDDRHTTADGLERTFAVNVLANHLLIGDLAARFIPGSRITITVSDTHFGDLRHNLAMVPAPRWMSPVELARPGAFGGSTPAAGRTAYSTSKLAAIHLVHEWSRRLPDGVEIVSYNPAYVPGTDLARDAGALERFANRRVLPVFALMGLLDRVPIAGRRLGDAILGTPSAASGEYLDRGRVAASSDESHDRARELELWEFLEAKRGALGPVQ